MVGNLSLQLGRKIGSRDADFGVVHLKVIAG